MDYFALLDQPRRPWLDTDALKARFLALSATAHPDRAHSLASIDKEAATQRFAELNAAYHCLREPKERLAHLLELETGSRPAALQENPAALVDLFFSLAQVFQQIDKFLKEKAGVTSPLGKAQLFAAEMGWVDQLTQLQSQITLSRETLETELKEMDKAWTSPLPLSQADVLYRQFSFLKRWSEQIQERLSRLAAA